MTQLRCADCLAEFPFTRPIPWCECGGLFDLVFDPPSFELDPSDYSMWRYSMMLPVKNQVSIGEPITPVTQIELAGRRVDAKLEFLFPTGSFKDRGAAVFISALKDANVEGFIEDSSGNAGASMATYAARAGMRCEVYCPASASGAKIAQIERTGAIIHRVEGSRQQATEVLTERIGGRFYASHNWHPMFLHGTKTLAYEIAEQYNWKPPMHIVSPTGGGAVILGLQLGFEELLKLGRISSVPLLYAIQAERCAPLVYEDVEPCGSLAEGIVSPKPPRLNRLRAAVAGAAAVTEQEISEGFKAMSLCGLQVEPTTAVLYFGVEKLHIPIEEPILVILTGSGLKFPQNL